jgi:glycosyltransferase involved in cell wall biosynthesis
MSASSALQRRPRLLFSVNVAWYFLSHRLSLAVAALARGYDVHLVADFQDHGEVDRVRAAGITYHRVHLERGGRSYLRDARLAAGLWRVYRALRPDIVHHVSIKPVLYGGIVARLLGVPGVVHAVPGMGYLFTHRDGRGRMLRSVVGLGYRLSMGGRTRVIFQNDTDRAEFVDAGWVASDRALLFPGSGVDVGKFQPAPEQDGRVTFTLPARILREKGVTEFALAARAMRGYGSPARFILAGARDLHNPGALSLDEIAKLCASTGVEWLGHVSDMPSLYRETSVVCLPSYREGTPKALQEACASGRAIIATDVPGCREVVRDGENGLLVAPRDADALAAAMQRLEGDAELRRRMGAAGRQRAILEFDERFVIERTLTMYDELLRGRPHAIHEKRG